MNEIPMNTTTPPEQIKSVAEAYKVYYAKSTTGAGFDTKNPDYNIDHSAFIYMMGKDGKFVRLFPYNAPDQEIVHAVQQNVK